MLRYKFILPVAYGIIAFVILFDVGPAFKISIIKYVKIWERQFLRPKIRFRDEKFRDIHNGITRFLEITLVMNFLMKSTTPFLLVIGKHDHNRRYKLILEIGLSKGFAPTRLIISIFHRLIGKYFESGILFICMEEKDDWTCGRRGDMHPFTQTNLQDEFITPIMILLTYSEFILSSRNR